MSTVCEHCGSQVDDGSALCTRCGVRRSQSPEVAPAQSVCVKCGSLLSAGAGFCTKCGAPSTVSGPDSSTESAQAQSSEPPQIAQDQWQPVQAPPSGRTQPRIQAGTASASSGTIPKILIIGLVTALILVATIATGVIYVAHRVKQKVAELTIASALAEKERRRETNSKNADSDFASALTRLGNGGSAATEGAQGAKPSEVPEDQAKIMADAALVSQALLRNLDKPPSMIPHSECLWGQV